MDGLPAAAQSPTLCMHTVETDEWCQNMAFMSTAGGTSLAYVYGGKGHLFLLVANMYRSLWRIGSWGLVDVTQN